MGLTETIWFVLLAIAVVVALVMMMKYAKPDSWKGKPWRVLVFSASPLVVVLAFGILTQSGYEPVQRYSGVTAPALLGYGAVLQVLFATRKVPEEDTVRRASAESLAISGWVAVLLGSAWAVIAAFPR